MKRYMELKKKLSSKMKKEDKKYKSTININISSSEEVLSRYTENNRPVINNEFAGFLENSVKELPVKQELTIKITCQEDKTETISSAIKNYYHNEFKESQRKLKSNLISSIILLIIGIVALTLSLIPPIYTNSIVSGTIDIFAWVFVWEAFDTFFFRRAELRHQQYRQINFINAKIMLK